MVWVAWEKLCTSKDEGGMGFKDLRVFNLSILVKQGWRIQQNPQSLVHRVFKTICFAGCSFREAQVGRNPSYAWRSIMVAKEVITRGTRWILGNVERVNIWQDKWIPTPKFFKVVSLRSLVLELEMVSSLIDRELRSWDTNKVKSTFLPHKVEVILGIPISPRLLNVSLIWAWTPTGHFSVKSVYKVAQRCLKERNASAESGGRKNLRWIGSSSQQHPGVYGTIEISSSMEDNVRRLARFPGKLLSTSRSLDKLNYKINVDGAVFKEIGCSRIGVVIRNDRGQLMGAMCKKIELPLTAFETEAVAKEEGILLAWDLGLKDVVIENDSMVVVLALSKATPLPWSIQKVMEGSRQNLSCFNNWSVVHVRRNGNRVAHMLARSAKSVLGNVIWVEDTPPIIAEQVLNDVIFLNHDFV
ncbi:hypothetical protein SO802_001433 [Lithocarpus litseifolius]|uniref:RNase H type-1 domain-containing protein n=1 Tax=Lithocarpus litseifolius TaxID=425828 RepID=A0AAW2DY62_9ROSI